MDIQGRRSNEQLEILVHEYEVAEGNAWVTCLHLPVQLVAALVHRALGQVERVGRGGVVPPVRHKRN